MRAKFITKLLGIVLAAAASCTLCSTPWFTSGQQNEQQVQSVQPPSMQAQSSQYTPSQIPSSHITSAIIPIPASVILDVENILQNPELPNGCEATSLAIVLNYLGFAADKTDIAQNYIPTVPIALENGVFTGGNPEEVYVGDAFGDGYYCYTSPVAIAANAYLRGHGSQLRAKQHNGIGEEKLIELLSAGTPVVVWKTIDNLPPAYSGFSWHLPNSSEVYSPLSNVHVVVLIGYDADNFYFCDPLGISPEMPREKFMDIFTQMNSRALAIA